MNKLAKISEITIYPFKSFAGIELNSAIVSKYGIAHPDNTQILDRKWMVVDENGSFMAARVLPKMVLIKPTIERDHFILNAPGKQPIKVPIKRQTNTKMKCRVFNLSIEGYVYNDNINKWISEFLDKENLFLVVFEADLEPRQVKLVDRPSNNGRDDDFIMYPDYSPILIISENSLSNLNERLDNKVTMKNFRPNFVVNECLAFAEDDWTQFKINESILTKVKHCTRCLLVTVDPEKGEKDKNQQPLQALKDFRTKNEIYGPSPMFGINCAPDNVGHLVRVGDFIYSI